ncbi:MAG: DUF4198 domain-containing protein [Bacillota bacterium]
MAPHNIYIRCPARVEPGETVNCTVVYGHYFDRDGTVDPGRLKMQLAVPERDIISLDPVVANEEIHASFKADQPGVYVLMAEYDNGVWSVDREGRLHRGRKDDNPDVDIERVVHYVKFAKSVIVCGEINMWPGSFGMELEVVPLVLANGEAELLVQYNGHSLNGCKVFGRAEGRPISRLAATGEDGTVTMTLAPGRWMIVVNHERPLAEPEVTRSLQAVLVLDVAG